MNGDIRISTDFTTHRKRKKLETRLGSSAVLALIDLWVNVAKSNPSGDLIGWDMEDIAIEANYTGDATEFIEALVELGFIDTNDGTYFSLHKWKERQPWASTFDVRSAKASKNQLKRWCIVEFIDKKDKDDFSKWYENYEFVKGDTAASILNLYGAYTDCIRKHTSRITPLPSPPPSPSLKTIINSN